METEDPLAKLHEPFAHDPEHRDRAGEPPCLPTPVPEEILVVLRNIPREQLVRACDAAGHPSFWLKAGYRYACVCGEMCFHD